MNRVESLRVIDEVFGVCPVVVTCGAPARELAAIRRSDSHLYLLDSMGLAAAIGIGLALAGYRPVAAIEGDGSLLMNLSVLSSIRALSPPGLTLIVLDNHEHASAGRLPTQAMHVDLGALARGAGLRTAVVEEPESLRDALEEARQADGPSVVIARIEGGNSPDIPLLLEDPAAIRVRFEGFLAGHIRRDLYEAVRGRRTEGTGRSRPRVDGR